MPAVQKAAAGVAASQTKGSPKSKGKRKAESDAESGERRWSSYVADQGCICKVKKTGMCMCHKWVILALMCCWRAYRAFPGIKGCLPYRHSRILVG